MTLDRTLSTALNAHSSSFRWPSLSILASGLVELFIVRRPRIEDDLLHITKELFAYTCKEVYVTGEMTGKLRSAIQVQR